MDNNEETKILGNPECTPSEKPPAYSGQPPHPTEQPNPGAAPYSGPQPYAGQPYTGQPYAGQPYTGQPYAGQPYTGQPYPGQPYPGQPYPGQPYPGAPYQVQGTVTSTSTIIVNEPTTQTGVVVTTVPDNMGLAIFSCLCCFWPLGLVAIYKANESQNALTRGDINGATSSARDSKRASLISIGLGVLIMIITTIIITTS